MKESLPLFIDFKEGRIQTGSESQTEFGFLRLLKILEKMMNLFNSRDLLNFIHPLFPTSSLEAMTPLYFKEWIPLKDLNVKESKKG